jgi:hypothetical protein
LLCHDTSRAPVLGFTAVQLGAARIAARTPTEAAALGYLHANCGHCHAPTVSHNNCHILTNPGGAGGMQARVLPSADTVEETQIYQSAVGRPLRYWVSPDEENHTESQLGELITQRIVPGDAESSAVWYRMSVREFGQVVPFNDHQQMPTVGTNEVDEVGLGAVEVWINSL